MIITCDPKPFLPILTEMPPSNSCPPFLLPSIDSANKIAPAQVPQTGLTLTNSLKGSNKPEMRARRAIVVDSPPGIIKASQAASSSGVLTSLELRLGNDLTFVHDFVASVFKVV